MKKSNNQGMHILILITALLFTEVLYNKEVKNTESRRNKYIIIEKATEQDQMEREENPEKNLSVPLQSFSEKEVPSSEFIDNESINTKFETGIIL
jgi:hypothetical protein